MTTVQESTNGHRVFPPLSSIGNPSEINSADLPTEKANNSPFAASDYHVPPKRFPPRAHAYRHDDFLNLPPETDPLPDRCQFMFSDGRQCTMARSDIHPSLCTYHSDREQQLFGDPSCRCEARTLDFPELFSASRDLTTAAGVNRALGQVFRMLAQRRISRQEAATFGHLAQLLLRTISLMRSETNLRPEERLPAVSAPVRQPECHAVAPVVSASDLQEASLPSSPMNAGDVSPARVMRSPVAFAQMASPPNSQTSRNEQFRESHPQALQNQQIQNLET